jgi:hypothetical protein
LYSVEREWTWREQHHQFSLLRRHSVHAAVNI